MDLCCCKKKASVDQIYTLVGLVSDVSLCCYVSHVGQDSEICAVCETYDFNQRLVDTDNLSCCEVYVFIFFFEAFLVINSLHIHKFMRIRSTSISAHG